MRTDDFEQALGSNMFLIANNIGFFTWDLEHDRNCGDHVMAELFDMDKNELSTGVSIEVILSRIAVEDKERLAKAVHEAITTGSFYGETYSVLHRDGKRRSVSAYGRCFRDAEGSPTHYAGFVTDVPSIAATSEESRCCFFASFFKNQPKRKGLSLLPDTSNPPPTVFKPGVPSDSVEIDDPRAREFAVENNLEVLALQYIPSVARTMIGSQSWLTLICPYLPEGFSNSVAGTCNRA